MLHTFRESVGKYIAIAILGLIAVTFIFFGIDFSVTRSNFAAKVNGTNIPVEEFDRQLQTEQAQFAQNFRIELTDDLRRTLRRQVIDRMIVREALRQQSEDSGYRVSDERLARSIQETPAFQVGGRFSSDAYIARLTAQGFTPAYYESLQREQLSMLELQDGVVASTFLTPAEYRRYIELYNERREIAYALFPIESFLAGVEISDAAVAEHHAANQSRYMTPETVDIEYVELDLASIAAGIELSDADLRQYYEEQRSRFETTEERRVRHILIQVEDDDYAAAEAEAADVVARLEASEDFAELAAEVSDDGGTRSTGGDLGWIARGTLPGAFEDALFSMDVGDIEGPVETEFGYHVLELTDVRRGDIRPYEDVEQELRDELSREQAESAFFDRANELADAAFDAFDELTSVAESLDMPLETIQGLTRAGDAELFPNSTPIVDAAFDEDAIVSGRNSDLLELDDDHVVVIRVAAHHAPEPEPLEAVGDQIRAELARNEAQLRAAEAAEAFLGELQGSTDQGAALAEAHGGQWNEATWVQRSSTEVPAEVLTTAFGEAKPSAGDAVTRRVPLSSGDEAVILVTGVESGDPAALAADEREQRRQQLADQAANLELAGYAGDVRDRATVRIPDEIINPQF